MPQTRLATYGTLAPGRVNNVQLENMQGQWITTIVKGKLDEAGWGSNYGYPKLTLDPSGEDIEVFVFESNELPDHWARLDEFEGDGYRRVETQALTSDGDLDVSIYVLARS